MLRVLAVHPPYVGAPDIRYVPLGFALVLAQTRRRHEVTLLDLLNNSAGWRDVDRALASADYDACLVSGFAMQVAGMREVVQRVRASSPCTRVVIGGAGVSDIPGVALQYTGADAVALGESETTALPMLASLEEGAPFDSVAGYAFRRGDAVVQNPKAPLVRDLDSLGLPAYDLFDVEAISRRSYNGWGYRSMFMESSRGCPFRCDFCINSVLNDPKLQSEIYPGATERNSTLRLRSVASLTAEIRHLRDRWGINDIVFSDEEFMTQKQRVFEVSNALKPLGIIFGVETGSQTMMDLMVKTAKKERVVAGLNAAREVGLSFLANFMVGHPGETAATIQESVDFCRDMGLVYLPSYTTLFPNSRMVHERKAAITDWDDYFRALSTTQYTSDLLFNLTDLPDAELVGLRTRAIAQTLGFKLLGANRRRLVKVLTPLLVACVHVAERLPRRAAFLLRNILRAVLDLRSPAAARQIPPHALADTTRRQTDGYEESLTLLDEAELAQGASATLHRR
jgi:anaerobic magnesium-protoporphyrin IX monomethyl ester cyclase